MSLPQNQKSAAEIQALPGKFRFPRKNILFLLALTVFIVLFIIKMLNPYSSPASALKTLIQGIRTEDETVLHDERFLFSNELTFRYGEEVLNAWKKIDHEGKILYERARANVRNRGREEFGKLGRMEREDIEEWSYRRHVNSIAYPLVKSKVPVFPDSLIFAETQAKNEFVHSEGIKTLKREEQSLIGNTTRHTFTANRDSFIRTETLRTNARKANSRYQDMMKLYSRIDKNGMAVYADHFEKLEQEARDSLNRLSKKELDDIRLRSYNEYVITAGYRAILNDIRSGANDRYGLMNYNDSLFLDENCAEKYRFEAGLKNAGSAAAAMMTPFDYRIGRKIRNHPQVFIHEAGRFRLFDFIRQQIMRETFSVTEVQYRSYETSLFHTPVAEIETNIGSFVFHQRGGEWFLADYR